MAVRVTEEPLFTVLTGHKELDFTWVNRYFHILYGFLNNHSLSLIFLMFPQNDDMFPDDDVKDDDDDVVWCFYFWA